MHRYPAVEKILAEDDGSKLQPVSIHTHENPWEFRLESEDIDPNDSYHNMVTPEFVQKYKRIMGEYTALMKELKVLHEQEKSPLT